MDIYTRKWHVYVYMYLAQLIRNCVYMLSSIPYLARKLVCMCVYVSSTTDETRKWHVCVYMYLVQLMILANGMYVCICF